MENVNLNLLFTGQMKGENISSAKAELLSVPLASVRFREQIRAVRLQFWLGDYKKGSVLTMYVEGR